MHPPPAALLAAVLLAGPPSDFPAPPPSEGTLLLERVLAREACAVSERDGISYVLDERRLDVVAGVRGRERLEVAEERRWYVSLGTQGSLRLLVARDGRALAPGEEERERRRAVEGGKAKRALRIAPEEVRDLKLQVVLRACEAELRGRATVDGRDTLVLDVRGRPELRPRSPAQKMARVLRATLWIDAEDEAVVRVEAEVPALRFLGGLAASVDFVRLELEQARVEPGVWLPVRSEASYRGRLHLLRRMDAVETATATGFVRFAAEAALAFGPAGD